MIGFLPQTMEGISSLAEALAKARNLGIVTEKVIELSSPNGEPRGTLQWSGDQHAFVFYPVVRG